MSLHLSVQFLSHKLLGVREYRYTVALDDQICRGALYRAAELTEAFLERHLRRPAATDSN